MRFDFDELPVQKLALPVLEMALPVHSMAVYGQWTLLGTP